MSVASITLAGDANGAPHPEPSVYATKFSGTYSHRTIEGGIGHNLPQEAPEAFADCPRRLRSELSRRAEGLHRSNKETVAIDAW